MGCGECFSGVFEIFILIKFEWFVGDIEFGSVRLGGVKSSVIFVEMDKFFLIDDVDFNGVWVGDI